MVAGDNIQSLQHGQPTEHPGDGAAQVIVLQSAVQTLVAKKQATEMHVQNDDIAARVCTVVLAQETIPAVHTRVADVPVSVGRPIRSASECVKRHKRRTYSLVKEKI